MSRKKRILIIIQLCFAFTFFSWLLMKPLVMQTAARKSHAALFEMVEQHPEYAKQAPIPASYTPDKSRLLDEPPFALAWLFFSVVVCLLLLFHIEGAVIASWLLPLLVVGYAYFLYANPPPPTEGLFPSEAYVRAHYLEEGEELLTGWHRYLVTEWAKTSPSSDPAQFEQQLDQGLFAFNYARLKWIREGKGDEVIRAGFATPPSLLRVMCYFIWNVVFAWVITRESRSAAQSSPS